MNRILSTIAILCMIFCTQELKAQEFDSAIGLRLGNPNSLSYKKYISFESALEGVLGRTSYGEGSDWYAGLAFQKHFDLDEVMDDLDWYIGAGGTLNFGNYYNSSIGISGQGFIGLQYNLNVPLNLTLDWTPTLLFLGTNRTFNGNLVNFSIRYILD